MCPAEIKSNGGSGREEARPYAKVTSIHTTVRDGWYNAFTDLAYSRLWPFAEISLRGKGDPERELGGVMSKHRDHLILSRCLSKGSAHGAHSSVSACQNGQSRVITIRNRQLDTSATGPSKDWVEGGHAKASTSYTRSSAAAPRPPSQKLSALR